MSVLKISVHKTSTNSTSHMIKQVQEALLNRLPHMQAEWTHCPMTSQICKLLICINLVVLEGPRPGAHITHLPLEQNSILCGGKENNYSVSTVVTLVHSIIASSEIK